MVDDREPSTESEPESAVEAVPEAVPGYAASAGLLAIALAGLQGYAVGLAIIKVVQAGGFGPLPAGTAGVVMVELVLGAVLNIALLAGGVLLLLARRAGWWVTFAPSLVLGLWAAGFVLAEQLHSVSGTALLYFAPRLDLLHLAQDVEVGILAVLLLCTALLAWLPSTRRAVR
jgi:hypothetical protein